MLYNTVAHGTTLYNAVQLGTTLVVERHRTMYSVSLAFCLWTNPLRNITITQGTSRASSISLILIDAHKCYITLPKVDPRSTLKGFLNVNPNIT